jgi:hypothetical protein
MKFAFVAKHRTIWPVAWLCEALGVSRSGFHAWIGRSLSSRDLRDEALFPQVRASFVASSRTDGARRVWRDILSDGVAQDRASHASAGLGEPVRAGGACLRKKETVLWLSSRRTGLIASSRQIDQPEMDRGLHLYLDGGGPALRCGSRSLLAPCGRLVDEGRDDGATGHRCPYHGDLAPPQAGRAVASFGSGQPR